MYNSLHLLRVCAQPWQQQSGGARGTVPQCPQFLLIQSYLVVYVYVHTYIHIQICITLSRFWVFAQPWQWRRGSTIATVTQCPRFLLIQPYLVIHVYIHV